MTDTTTIPALRAAQRAAGREFADRLADITGAALELVEIETTLRVAETRAGEPSRGPQARELAVDLPVGRLGCLRPHLPFVTTESANRAAEVNRPDFVGGSRP